MPRKVCYSTGSVQDEFYKLGLLPTERKIVMRVLSGFPEGKYEYRFPFSGKTANGEIVIFIFTAYSGEVVISEIKRRKTRWATIVALFGRLFRFATRF